MTFPGDLIGHLDYNGAADHMAFVVDYNGAADCMAFVQETA